MKAYTVSQLAEMAGVSVRTLHHYDHVGVLRPSTRTAAGYRLYGEQDLLRLQQILFFRELDFSLEEIREILNDPEFDLVGTLKRQREVLQRRVQRLARLLTTIDRTILRVTEQDVDMKDEELYEGLSREKIARYKREAREMYDPALVEESERRVRRMSKEEWKAVGAEGDEVTRALAALTDRPVEEPEVQALIARHYAWIEHFYPTSAEVYSGLGQLYATHPEFRAFYEKYAPGLAHFMAEAMAYYAEHNLR